MKISNRKIYVVSIIADKGKIFDENLIISENILNEEELESLKIINGGHAIKWSTTIDYGEISDNQYKKWFTPTQIKQPETSV